MTSIKTKLLDLEKTIEALKSNEISIEEQIDLYKDALKKCAQMNRIIEGLKHDIEVIEKEPKEI